MKALPILTIVALAPLLANGNTPPQAQVIAQSIAMIAIAAMAAMAITATARSAKDRHRRFPLEGTVISLVMLAAIAVNIMAN